MRQVLFFFLLLSTLLWGASNTTDSLRQLLQQHPEVDTTRLRLLNEVAYNLLPIDPHQSEVYALEALEISSTLREDEAEAFSYRILGLSHWTRGNYEQALAQLNEARHRYSRLNDQLGIANSVMNIGIIYNDLKNYELALQHFNASIQTFDALGRKDRIAATYVYISQVNVARENYQAAFQNLTEALRIHEQDNYLYGVSQINEYLGRLFITQGKLDEALPYLFRSLNVGMHEGGGNVHGAIKAYEQSGTVYLKKEEYGLAKEYLSKGLELAQKLETKPLLRDLYAALRRLAKAENDSEAELRYYEQFNLYQDSIFNEEKAREIAALQTEQALAAKELELKVQQQEIALLEREKRLNRQLLIIALLIVSALIIIGLITAQHQRKNVRKNQRMLEQEQRLREQENTLAQVELENAELRKRELQLEISQRDRQLTTYTMNLAQKNEMLHNLKHEINELKKRETSTAMKKDLARITRTIDSNFQNDQDWEDFKMHFEHVHPDFFENLKQKFPRLTQNDLRLSALIRLNLTIKEIANLLYVSPDSVKKARYRLRKKLNLDTNTDLSEALSHFDNTIVRS